MKLLIYANDFFSFWWRVMIVPKEGEGGEWIACKGWKNKGGVSNVFRMLIYEWKISNRRSTSRKITKETSRRLENVKSAKRNFFDESSVLDSERFWWGEKKKTKKKIYPQGCLVSSSWVEKILISTSRQGASEPSFGFVKVVILKTFFPENTRQRPALFLSSFPLPLHPLHRRFFLAFAVPSLFYIIKN